MPEIWTGAASLVLFLWFARETDRVAFSFESARGRWWHPPGLAAAMHGERQSALFAALLGLLWIALGQALLIAGTRARSTVLRVYAYLTSAFGLAVTATALFIPDGWSSDLPLVLDASGLLTLAALAVLAAGALGLHGTRELRRRGERFAGEIWASGVILLLLVWSRRQSDHVARTIAGIPGVHGHVIGEIDPAVIAHVQTLGAVITSGAWTLEALALLVLGWRRRSAFLRWSGLALLGVTVVKFLAFDLSTVDVFWRFLIAVAVGAAMLAVSYAYQRRAKDARAT
jgi:peptidoglycan/LPS O-acetylase OafA/YrhL